MSCEHELGERETACADGMCPLCLAADNTALRMVIKDMRRSILDFARERNEGYGR